MEKSFFEKVYDITEKIPYGRVTTYGAIAAYIGSPQAGRMVGWALNKCGSINKYIPAHRVVNRNGMLTGKIHFANSQTMKELLEREGIVIINDKVNDFEFFFWKPE